MRKALFCAVTVLAAAGMIGCGNQIADGLPNSVDCSTCHGGPDNTAPPLSLSGSTATEDVAVGAHQAHLHGGRIRAGIECSECHLVPQQFDAPGHIDPLPAEVVFGQLAGFEQPAGQEPVWERQSVSCRNVYCHGASLSGGSLTQPLWTKVDDSQAACGTCHGLPPPPPHTASDQCNQCHPETVLANGTIDVAGGKHINGSLEVEGMDCSSCHGQAGNPAPPPDTSGNTATSAPGVGAHQSHLRSSDWRGPVACSECHLVPSRVGAPGHLGSELPAEVIFGALAAADNANGSYNEAMHSCSGVYCHGATLLTGGSNTAPVWTTVDGNQAACGTCHGLPPAEPHPSGNNCQTCHGEVIGAGGVFVDPSKHINGTVEHTAYHPPGWADGDVHGEAFEDDPNSCKTCHGQNLDGGSSGVSCNRCHGGFLHSCTFCHGGEDNQSGAPPPDVAGETETSVSGVGAHSSHLRESSWRAAIRCSDCHQVPEDALSPGHVGTGPVELQFSRLAVMDGASPQFDGASCSDVYCHGATLIPGGGNITPVWTQVDGSQAACGTCHGLPPQAPHPQDTGCDQCHGQVIGAGGFVEPELHINGVVEIGDGS